MKKLVAVLLVLSIICSNQSMVTAKTRYEYNLKPTWRNVLWLAKCMYAENGHAQDDDTVLLTGIVVCQRVRAKSYPSTIKRVISQSGQYSTWRSGRIQSCEPDERCLELAEEILRFKIYKDYPHNLVFQSQFPQGKMTYKYIKKDNEYFCLA